MRKPQTIISCRTPALTRALFLASCLTAAASLVDAQDSPTNVATAQRETLLQVTEGRGDRSLRR